MRKIHLALTAMVAVAAGLLAPLSPSAAATTWNDGFQDQDQIIDCITGGVSTGVSANVGWSSPTGQVPKIGEKFYLRGYVGLVGLPCSGKVAVFPEIMVPAGVEYVDEDVRWDLYKTGESPVLTTEPLVFDYGVNGGILVGPAPETAFTLRQGDILEFQFPVKATRELKGPATQQPQCQSRLDGDAPCPISQAGDHLQIAFTVGGHGGDKSYVTPFVGLFASNGTTTPTPTPTPTPTSKVDSTTKAKVSPKRPSFGNDFTVIGKVKAENRALRSKVVFKLDGKRIGSRKIREGRAVMTVRRNYGVGKHVLTVIYRGTSKVAPSRDKLTFRISR